MSVRTKLFGGFAVAVACALALGLISLSKLASTNSATKYIATNSLPSLKVTALARGAVKQLRADQASYVLAPAGARGTYATRIATDVAIAGSEITYYGGLLTDARDTSNWRAVKSLWATYRQQSGSVERLVGSRRAGAAGSVFFAAQPVYDELVSATTQWHDYNLTIGDREYGRAEANYSSARTLVILVIAFAVLISSAIAYLCGVGVSRPPGVACLWWRGVSG